MSGAKADSFAPWWIVLIVWPLAVMSFVFAYLMLYGLPGMSQLSFMYVFP